MTFHCVELKDEMNDHGQSCWTGTGRKDEITRTEMEPNQLPTTTGPILTDRAQSRYIIENGLRAKPMHSLVSFHHNHALKLGT